MSDPNARNSGEEEVNTSKQDNSNSYARLIRDFSKDKLKDKNQRSQYVRTIRSNGVVSPELLAEIQEFAGKNKEFDGLEITTDKINYHSLVRETGAFYTTLSNNKRAVKDMYLQEYDMSDKDLSSMIDTKLDELTEQEVQDLLQNDKKRKLFLQKNIGKKPFPIEKSIVSFFKDFNLAERYTLLSEEEKYQFYDVAKKLQSGQKIDDLDLEILFDTNVYNQKEKEKLLNKFIPSISLAQARDYGIITDAQANDLKYQQVKSLQPDLSGDDIQTIVNQIRDEDIVVATVHFTAHKTNREALIGARGIFEDFAEKYNNIIDKAQAEVQKGGVMKLSDFKENLERFSKVSGAEKLQVGSIIKIHQTQETQDGTSKTTVLFGQLTALGNDGNIQFIEKSTDDKYDSSGKTQTTETYSDFLSYIENGNPNKGVSFQSLEVLTQSELDAQIRSGDIDEYQPKDLKFETTDSIDSDIESMTRDIDGLKKALREKKTQIRNDLHKQGFGNEYIEEQIGLDPWVKDYEKKIEEITRNQSDKEASRKSLGGRNIARTKEYINELDPDGKQYGFDRGTTLKTKQGNYYTITSVEETLQKISLHSIVGDETYTLEEFYQGFESQETKRVNKQEGDMSAVLNHISGNQGDFAETWKGFEFKDGKIQRENTKSKIDYDYLVGVPGKTKELLKIHNISAAGDRITVSFGELKSKGKKDKNGEDLRDDDNNKVKDEKFTLDGTKYIVSTGFLQEYIKDNSLEPRSLRENQEVSADGQDIEKMNKKFHLFSWMFHERATIADAVKGGTIFYEQLKEMIEMGSEEKANQFALKYMGALMTGDAKRDLQSRLEQKQKKTMEEYVERLETVASDVALEMIEQWLQDKYGPPFQKEAAVVFMFKKYGVLNAKAMQKHEGKWWWYQALGGEPYDDFFNEVKAEKDKLSLPFTEELLVYKLIRMQCRKHGFNGIKRRSKFHKEVKKIRATGKEDEYETGKRDAKDERDILGRVEGGLGELHKNNNPNYVGWMEEVINKGGTMHDMNKLPFVAAFSGVAYGFEEKTTEMIKKFSSENRILMMLRFFSYHRDLDVLNNAILHVCQSIEDKGNHPGIGIKAQELYNDLRNPKGGIKARVQRAEAFYDEYGEVITNAIYMLNTGKESQSVNKIIFFEKDYNESEDHQSTPEEKKKKRERAKAFTDYFNELQGHMRMDETKVDDEGLMMDAFLHAGTSGMDMYKMSKELLVMRQGGWKNQAGPDMWKEIKAELKAIPRRKSYDPDPIKNEQMQRQLLEFNLRGIMAGIMGKMQNGNEIAGYNQATGPFNILNKWGIDMTNFADIKGFTTDDLLKGGHDKTDKMVLKFVDNIMNAELHEKTYYHEINNQFSKEDKSADDIGSSITTTKEKVSRNTSAVNNDSLSLPQASANDNDPFNLDPKPATNILDNELDRAA